MDRKQPNIGWLFYKAYYSELKPALKAAAGQKSVKDLDLKLEEKNATIHSQKLQSNVTGLLALEPFANCVFDVRTQYPGLMAGLGTQHSVGHEEEVKLGFNFDHTTGLPYLPASSVKGVLRSYFPSRLRAASLEPNLDDKTREALKAKADQLTRLMLEYLLPKAGWTHPMTELGLEQLENLIFSGQLPTPTQEGDTHLGLYQRDIFFDAYPVASHFKGDSAAQNGCFLGEDAITPHGKNPLKNPVPLRLLKVLPEVRFQFQFRLQDSRIDGNVFTIYHKFELFQEIITTFGIGAKTNVGYGRVDKEE
jgi:CRISPR-associated protein Cmr6